MSIYGQYNNGQLQDLFGLGSSMQTIIGSRYPPRLTIRETLNMRLVDAEKLKESAEKDIQNIKEALDELDRNPDYEMLNNLLTRLGIR